MGQSGGHKATPRDVGEAATLSDQLSRVRRYWWLVLAMLVLSVAGAVLATQNTPTTYTGRASLIVSSNDRSPEQDAVLVQGYADYFNGAAYQSKLLVEGDLQAGVGVVARAAAGSPILLIDATADDAATAQSSATAVATAFQEDVNQVRNEDIAAKVRDLQRELDRQVALAAESPRNEALQAVISDLQDSILELRSDQVNMLQELQLQGGVSEESPRLSLNILFALVGGLIVGAMAALAVGRSSRRLVTPQDVDEKLGVTTLVEVPAARTARLAHRRRLRLRQMSNAVRAQLGGRTVVAVTEPTNGLGAAFVAWGLARHWAEQGYPTLLVRANGQPEKPVPRGEPDHGEIRDLGLFDFPTDAIGRVLNSSISSGPVSGMWVLSLRRSSHGLEDEVRSDKIQELLTQSASLATYVVIESPPVVESADAQALCTTAGRTLLVIEGSVTRVPEASEAIKVLEQTDSGLLGAVLVHSAGAEGWDTDVRTDRPTSSGLEHVASSKR